MTKKIKAKAQDTQPSPQELINNMWTILGIPEPTQTIKRVGIDFPKVLTADGWTDSKTIMKQAGFIVDNHMPKNMMSTVKNYATDSSVPSGYGQFATGTVNINQINGLALDNTFLGWGELSLLQQNCLINNICSIFAQCMTEKWIKFTSKDKAKEEKIKRLEEKNRQLKLKDKMAFMIYKVILLGTAYVSPKIKGDEEDIENPLILDSSKIKKGSLEDIYIIEPTWVVPVEFNMINPRAPNFYSPQYYVVYGERIHCSRMARFMYTEPVNLLAPMYLFGGIPLIQQILPYILDFINTKKQIVQVVSRFNTSVLKTNLNALHGTNGYAKGNSLAGNTKGRAQAFNAMRNNFGLFLLDKEEEFAESQISVSGLVDILQQQAEFLSLFLRIPISELFGQAPRGMNATGEFDANKFNNLIHTLQEDKLRPVLEYLIKIIMLDEFGEIDEEISFEFVPLGELNETTQSQLKTEKVNRATALVSNGMAEGTAMMELLMQDPTLELGDYDISANNQIDLGYENEETEEEITE